MKEMKLLSALSQHVQSFVTSQLPAWFALPQLVPKKKNSVPTVTWMDKPTLSDRQRGEAGHFASGFMQSRSYSICYTALLHKDSCLHVESYPLPHLYFLFPCPFVCRWIP